MTTTRTTTPAYMVDEGQNVQVPGTDRVKKIYRVQDAGTRYEVNELGQTEHIPQITFHYNAPPRSGMLGYFTVDYDAELVAR